MKIAFFSAQPYDKSYFNLANDKYGFEIEYFDTHLGPHSLNLVNQAQAVCVFVNDKLSEPVIKGLSERGVKSIALRCAGFNQLDQEAAKKYGIPVCRVPAYSPYAVAEHAVALILALNRKTHKAYNRVREQNFSLSGLTGFDLHGKTVGVVGTGHIGEVFSKIMLGFGCRVLAYDPNENKELKKLGVENVKFDDLLHNSHIISLHCPLIPNQTKHLINSDAIQKMKKGVMLINTSRGGLVDTEAVIQALKSSQIGYLGIDVYEQEERLFFKDHSSSIIDDDLIQRLISFPNVMVTAHQAFFTDEALKQISQTTLESLSILNKGDPLPASVSVV